MSIEDHPAYDDSGHLKINEKHLMVFLHFDGFTERLFNIKIFITKSYELEVYFRTFKKGNKYGGFEHEYITKEIPEEILTFLDELPKLEKLDIGYVSQEQTYSMEDASVQEVLFNHHGKTVTFCISDGIMNEEKNFTTAFGKRFYHFCLFLNNWIEKINEDFDKS